MSVIRTLSTAVKPIAFLITALRPIVVSCSSTRSPLPWRSRSPGPRGKMAGGRTRPLASLDRRFLRLSRRRRGFLGLVRGGGLPGLLDQYLQRAGGRDGQQRRDETAEYAADQAAE
jgi:hypothetical protein